MTDDECLALVPEEARRVLLENSEWLPAARLDAARKVRDHYALLIQLLYVTPVSDDFLRRIIGEE
jgi:hypothetical protein